MNEHDTDPAGVLDALKDSMDGVTMTTPVEQIVHTGRTRQRHRLAAVATGAVAATGLALGAATLANPSAAPPTDNGAGVHIKTVAYSVDKRADGTILVTWDKRRTFEDPAGLEAALHAAGFPVLVKVGEFCRGPQDDVALDPSGTGPGVDLVVRRISDNAGDASFIYDPAAMPAGKQLFIGYLNAAQLEVTGGAPGSVERLVPIDGPLTCTTVAPPAHAGKGSPGVDDKGSPGVGDNAGAGADGKTKPTAPVSGAPERGPGGVDQGPKPTHS